MSTIRVQGGDNFGGFSHAGQSYMPDDDGVIEIPAHIPTEVLTAHGLKPAGAKVERLLAKDAPKAPKGGKKEGVADDRSNIGSDQTIDGEPLKPAKEDAPKAPKGGKKEGVADDRSNIGSDQTIDGEPLKPAKEDAPKAPKGGK